MKTNNLHHYDAVSKVFHWVTAIMVFAAFVLGPGDFGRLVDSGGDPGARLDIVWHESLGMGIFLITLCRLIWVAIRRGAPRHGLALALALLSRARHVALWALALALPISALMALGSESNPLTLLGGFRLNELPWISSSPLAGVADCGQVHKLLGDAIIWLAGIHAVAGLYHHFKLKDGVLQSMLPGH